MKNTRKVAKTHVRRDTTSRFITAGLIVGLIALLSALPATAGSSSDAEITDVAGDANFISALTADQRDTRPASIDNADIRSVWFETAYSTTKVTDPVSGQVLRVEHRPTALLVNIQTQAAVRPLSPWSGLRFKVPVTVPTCQASLELTVGATANLDKAEIRTASGPSCWTDGNGLSISPVTPTYAGAVSTMTFPFSHPQNSAVLSPGTALTQAKANVTGSVSGTSTVVVSDQTGPGRSFTIGQDVPPDIDCSADPTHPECDS